MKLAEAMQRFVAADNNPWIERDGELVSRRGASQCLFGPTPAIRLVDSACNARDQPPWRCARVASL
jgi:hypothetical protein